MPYTPKYTYTYKKEPEDERDLKFKLEVKLIELNNLPLKVDLRTTGFIPPILDQLMLNACVAAATCNALMYCLKKEKATVFKPSRLYMYYFCRFIENTVNQDAGCYIRTAMQEIQTYGACNESLWPYYISRYKIRPSNTAVRDALTHVKGFKYMSLDHDIIQIKTALAMGYPIMFGIAGYESFESDDALSTGNIPIPNVETEMFLGGHAILLIGYDDDTKLCTFMNSWGTGVGQKGYFTIPYEYVSSHGLAFDFWCITFFK